MPKWLYSIWCLFQPQNRVFWGSHVHRIYILTFTFSSWCIYVFQVMSVQKKVDTQTDYLTLSVSSDQRHAHYAGVRTARALCGPHTALKAQKSAHPHSYLHFTSKGNFFSNFLKKFLELLHQNSFGNARAVCMRLSAHLWNIVQVRTAHQNEVCAWSLDVRPFFLNRI